nr:uncharacterized protein LOC128689041 [Cherax quadricarinatus]
MMKALLLLTLLVGSALPEQQLETKDLSTLAEQQLETNELSGLAEEQLETKDLSGLADEQLETKDLSALVEEQVETKDFGKSALKKVLKALFEGPGFAAFEVAIQALVIIALLHLILNLLVIILKDILPVVQSVLEELEMEEDSGTGGYGGTGGYSGTGGYGGTGGYSSYNRRAVGNPSFINLPIVQRLASRVHTAIEKFQATVDKW